jgi:hypothetical protein
MQYNMNASNVIWVCHIVGNRCPRHIQASTREQVTIGKVRLRDESFPEYVFHADIALSLNTWPKQMKLQTPNQDSFHLHSLNQHHRATAHLSATVQPRDTLNSAFLKGIVRLDSTTQAPLC